jgi:hypothetical protein
MKLTTTMLDQLTRQDLFDVIAWNLLRQNAKATAPDGVKCRYRAPDGKRCAIGWIMPDDVYSEALEYRGVPDVATVLMGTEYGGDYARFLDRHIGMLNDFQEMHDARQPREWPVYLRAIAQRHGLNANTVDHYENARNRAARARKVRPSHDMRERLGEPDHVLA